MLAFKMLHVCGVALKHKKVLSAVPAVSVCKALSLRSSLSRSFSRLSPVSSLSDKMFKIEERGTPNTLDYRIFFRNENGPISPLHDIPLYANAEKKIYNMVVEVSRWTNAKMEICLKEPLNPIKQDVKKGQLRYVANCFPHHGYIWNYGALPQTWENPDHLDDSTGCKGDNDPIDVLEIGYRVANPGEVLQIKILGTLALIDEGETDWKLIGIDVNDPVAEHVKDINDVEKYFPGLLKASVEWFKIYKIPDGKPENQFAFNGEAKNAEFAHKVINEVNTFWTQMINHEVDAGEISCVNTTNDRSPFIIGIDEAEETVEKAPYKGEPECVDPIVDKWHYLHLK